jgi:hypothetical protein
LKVTAELRKDFCPICQHELVKIRYLGDKRLNLSVKRDSFEDYMEDGQVVFVEKVSRWVAVARQKWYSEEEIFHLKDDWIDKMLPKGGDNCA